MRPAERRPSGWANALPAWAYLAPIVLVVSTEYKVRRRPIADALSGRLDSLIAVELAVYAVVGIASLAWLSRTRMVLTPLLVVMWGYLLTTAASALYAPYAKMAIARAVQLVIIGLVVHMLAVAPDHRVMARVADTFVMLTTVSIAAGIVYVAPVSVYQKGRFTWLSTHSVVAGAMLAIAVCILAARVLTVRTDRSSVRWRPGVYWALLALHLGFLLRTQTRGSIAAALIAIGVMAWINAPARARSWLVIGTAVGASAVVLAFGKAILRYVARGESVQSFETFNRRTEIWSLAWKAFQRRPVEGLGFTSARGVFFDDTGLGGAHNALVNVATDAGLLGLVWWLAVIILSIAALRRLRRLGAPAYDTLALAGILCCLLLNGVTTEGLGAGVSVSAIMLFLAVAWITVLQRQVAGTAPSSSRPMARSGRIVAEFHH